MQDRASKPASGSYSDSKTEPQRSSGAGQLGSLAMDDLSINISGLAPGAARTIQALGGRKRGSDGPSKRKAKPLTGRGKKNPTERLQEKEPAGASNHAKRKREAPKPKPRKEPKPSKQAKAKVLEAWKRTQATATPARAEAAKAVRKPLHPSGADPTPSKPPKKPKIRERREAPRKAAELKESGVVSETAFAALKLHESLLRQLQYLGFTDCTPIQALAVPRALTGKRDVLLRAPTGSGKTLAFLLPVLHQLLVTPGGIDRRTAKHRKA